MSLHWFLDKKSLWATVHDQADFKDFFGVAFVFLGRPNSQRPLIVGTRFLGSHLWAQNNRQIMR